MPFFLFLQTANAWHHEIAMGYGYGKELVEDYVNSGVVVSGKFFEFPTCADTLLGFVEGTTTDIKSETPEHNHLSTLSAALGFRAYAVHPNANILRPYLEISFGPSYLFEKQLGNCRQAKNFAFQTALSAGTEIGYQDFSFDINIKLIHYCNAGIWSPNGGIDLLPILSIGYLF